MEQPNNTDDGDAALTPMFWLAVVATGVMTGLFGAALLQVLFAVERLAFGAGGSFGARVAAASDLRRITALLVAGALGGPAWYLLRRFTPGQQAEVDDALWHGDGRLSWARSLGTSIISEVVIGFGASLGREAAPKLMGGVSGTLVAGWTNLSVAQRRLLVACGGGAGLGAVYNVPLGGAFFTAEILVGAVALPVILPALACSCIATAAAWVVLPSHATYLGIPPYHSSVTLITWAVVAGPLIGLLASGAIRLVGWVSFHQARRGGVIVAPLAAFAVLGVVGLRYPQLYGNGQDMARQAFVGHGTLLVFAALAVCKPLMTSLCLASGASGGLFTPVMSTGAVMGAAMGVAWSQLWPGAPVGAFAVVGAAAMIGAGMQAPLAALTLVLELTHSGFALMVPMMLATVLATGVARMIDGYSIYSARLARPDPLPRR